MSGGDGPRAAGPAVHTIPSQLPFVDVLAAGIRARVGGDPAALGAVHVLLPTRRACRALAEAFLRAGGGVPMLLPRMSPLGDVDDDDLALEGAEDAFGALDVPPAMPEARRRLLLARLILASGEHARTPDQAVRLAGELARLIDQVRTERLDFDKLADLAPERFAEHWQTTLRFLAIVTEAWPKVLADHGMIDPAERRNRLIEARTEVWRAAPPDTLVVAAGSTGSVPATADLLQVIANLPHAAVVLPGLDTEASEGAWTAIASEPSHPQFGMARLLERLEVDRSDVRPWHTPAAGNDERTARVRFVQQALAPPMATPSRPSAASPPDTFDGVTTVVAPTPREEAGIIALALRGALETPAKTAMLVTPDRALARRVTAELGRWSIDIDDSAGRALALTAPGVFLRLLARAVAEDVAPVALLALLKHPLTAAGMAPETLRERARTLERTVLRGVRPAPGISGIRAVLGAEEGAFTDVLSAIEQAIQPFVAALARNEVALADVADAHVRAAEALARTDTEDGATRLWAGDAGEVAAGRIAEILDAGEALGAVVGVDYPALFEALIAETVVRPRYGRHPRLAIFGPLEARLQSADLVILGGLNEGTWPPEARANPWMSRPMMASFGLPLPERRVGLAAHDFAQAVAAPEVVLTRSERVDGTPTVPSRWLMRLSTLAEAVSRTNPFLTDRKWLQWLRDLDRPEGPPRPVDRPAPTPPVEARPKSLSVTRIETWIRDAYAIYARNILGLEPLAQLDQSPEAAERGILVHDILERFVASHPDVLPDDALAALIDIGRARFREFGDRPGVQAFWWPRFVRAAGWFIGWERRRRALGWQPAAIERKGRLMLAGLDFELRGRADRIERGPGSSLAIIDYKTGALPGKREVMCGLAPQLSLEAAMAAAGAFSGVETAAVDELVYVKVSGSRQPGDERMIDEDVPDLATRTMDGLRRRIAAFQRPETPYLSRERVQFEGREGDYDHLARVREWGVAGGDEG